MLLNLLNINEKNMNKENMNEQNVIKIKKDNATLIWKIIPNDILEKIFALIPDYKKIHLSKNYYLKYHFLIKQMISLNKYESYLYFFIKNDFSFVFDKILSENICKWNRWKNYRHKSIIYHSYLHFIFNEIEKYNSIKCKQIFINSIQTYFNSNKNNNASFNTINWFKNNNIRNVRIE